VKSREFSMIFLNPPEALLPKSLKNIYSLPEGYTKKNLDKAGATFGVLLTRCMIAHPSLPSWCFQEAGFIY